VLCKLLFVKKKKSGGTATVYGYECVSSSVHGSLYSITVYTVHDY